MSYNAHTIVSAENISRLPFIEGQFVYYFRQDSVNTCGILYSLNKENYEKAIQRLEGCDQAEIKPGDIVYLMPGSKIPGFKIKDHMKKCGARLSTDIDKATIFIGNRSIVEKITTNSQEKSNSLLFDTFYTNHLISDSDLVNKQEQIFNKTDAYNSLIDPTNRSNYATLLSKYVINRVSSLEYNTQGGSRFITPAGANIIYNSILKKIPIINEDLLLTQIAPSIVIDENSYDSIESMLSSSDQESINTGVEIVCNCDIEKSLLYLWKLSKNHYSAVSRAHSKNSRLFIEKSKWNTLNNYNAEEFIVHLKELGLLTKEWCRILIQKASEVYKDNLKSNMFKMILIPTQEYFEYVDKTDIFEFNHKSNKDDESETV